MFSLRFFHSRNVIISFRSKGICFLWSGSSRPYENLCSHRNRHIPFPATVYSALLPIRHVLFLPASFRPVRLSIDSLDVPFPVTTQLPPLDSLNPKRLVTPPNNGWILRAFAKSYPPDNLVLGRTPASRFVNVIYRIKDPIIKDNNIVVSVQNSFDLRHLVRANDAQYSDLSWFFFFFQIR